MIVIESKAELRAELAKHHGRSIGFVPTMGYLHEGHLSLFRAARAGNDVVVASIYVNPTQFAPGEDLETYPRDAEGDLAKARSCGVDILWMPRADQVYAPDHSTRVVVDGLQEGLCGISRPHFFTGVATVVAKLFVLVRPTRAYFGEKDYQQLTIVRRLARDLDLGVEVIGCPLVREDDGIAMSSRNAYLSAEEREQALALNRALRALDAQFRAGERSADALRSALHSALDEAPGVQVDYAELVNAHTLENRAGSTLPDGPETVAALAAWVGTTRLLDNVTLGR